MKNNLKTRISVINFEPIKQIEEEKLIGGFSVSISHKEIDSIGTISNNCEGGNCSSGCGTGQNVGCNTSAGCDNIGR